MRMGKHQMDGGEDEDQDEHRSERVWTRPTTTTTSYWNEGDTGTESDKRGESCAGRR